jgi:glycerol uptake facilitator-like aquaporin
MKREVAAEALGSALLFATVIGSGVMAEKLAAGYVAMALLGNTLATGAMLFVLITMLGPVSGAHFNPAVTIVMRLRGEMASGKAAAFILAQLVGGIIGVWTAHAMFDLPILQVSQHTRTGAGQWTGEFVATFGLLLTILGTLKSKAEAVPMAVALYIIAAYWFTSSTSFANPAITIARSLSNTFAGIAPENAPAFIVAQFAGALVGWGAARLLFSRPSAA